MATMSATKRNLLYATLILVAIPLTACNTVKGAGRDVKSVGNAVEEGADEVGDEMGD